MGDVMFKAVDWMADALCAQIDPDLWHPEKGRVDQVVLSRRVCRGNPEQGIPPCPVIAQCLEYALSRPELGGIWAGTTPVERQILRRRMRAA